MYRLFLNFFLYLVILGCTNLSAQNSGFTKSNHIQKLLSEAQDNSKTLQNKKSLLKEAIAKIDNLESDSLKVKLLLKIVDEIQKTGDTLLYIETNKMTQNLAREVKDTLAIAETFWNKGAYHLNRDEYLTAYKAYFKAKTFYDLAPDEYYSAQMLYNIAFIQGRLKDYARAESNLFQAIAKYQRINKNLSLYRCYSLLGVIYKDRDDFENALTYQQRALNQLDRVKNKRNFKEGTLNDLGLVYQKLENFDKAILTFKEALSNDIIERDSLLYAKLLDNLAYTRLLKNDTSGVKREMMTAFSIRENLNHSSGIIANKMHLAEYYISNQDTSKAIQLATEAYSLAQQINNNDDILESLLLLSKIDKPNSSSYFQSYAILNDSIEKNERILRDKFARVRFETDEFIDKSERLSEQRTIIIIGSVLIIIILGLLYFIKTQRSKAKLLASEKEQEATQSEMFRLMLQAKDKKEEGKRQERNRIAEELHDGVVGKLFGTRMKLGYIDVAPELEDEQENNLSKLQELEEEIREISHNLKSSYISSEKDFVLLLDELKEEYESIYKFSIQLVNHTKIGWKELNDKTKITIYRILQETLTNIQKHAKAKNVNIKFSNRTNSELQVIIEDDGVGFEVDKVEKGIGLDNIEERIKRLNGTLEIESELGIGTKFIILLPN